MSALPPKADIAEGDEDVRFVPEAAVTSRPMKGRPHYNPQMLRLGRGLKAHEVRGDAKPPTISPFVDIRVTTKPNVTVQPLIPVTGVNDRNVTQNPYHHVHSLCFRPRIWIGHALQKRFAIQQSSIWSGDIKILGKIF
jgi:hypothetical protein